MKQLMLFASPKLLLERFGHEFFKGIPSAPGVYFFRGNEQQFLYIGQSGNLRKRLNGYKNLSLDAVPRRTRRLFHYVQSIHWELCESSREARLRENELLQLHKPKFNVLDTWPEGNSYIALKNSPEHIEIRVTKNGADLHANEQMYGAFKGAQRIRAALHSLIRLVWIKANSGASPEKIPFGFFRNSKRDHFRIERIPADLDCCHSMLHSYFSGTSSQLVEFLADAGVWRGLCQCQVQLFETDVAELSTFYALGPQRNHTLRARFGLESTIIVQSELSQLLIRNSWATDR